MKVHSIPHKKNIQHLLEMSRENFASYFLHRKPIHGGGFIGFSEITGVDLEM